jgi:hypothetical protein
VSLKVLSAARDVNQLLADRLVDKIARRAEFGREQRSRHSRAGVQAQHEFRGRIVVGTARGNAGFERRARASLRSGGDPRSQDAAQRFGAYCDSAYAAAEGVDALVVGTGWPEFRALDFDRIKHLLKKPIIVDTKNLLDSARLRALGFEYVGVGRG